MVAWSLLGLWLALAGTAQAAAPTTFAPGNTADITVAEQPGLTGQQVVNEQGQIRLPLIGALVVKNQSPADVALLLTAKLKKYIRQPQVTVRLAELARYRVSVLGDVQHPQAYSLPRGATVLEALLGAGGPVAPRNRARLTLRRAGKEQALPLPDLLAGKAADKDLPLQPGDVLQVTSLPAERIFLLGQVGRPGPLEFRTGMTLASALAEVGGLRDEADGAHATLKRADSKPWDVNLDALIKRGDPMADVKLQPGDTVFVPKAAPASEAGPDAGGSTDDGVDGATAVPDGAVRVRVVGAVGEAGEYVLTATDPVEKITEAVLAAQNFAAGASGGKIIIARRILEEGKEPRAEAFTINYRKLLLGKVKDVPDLQTGDVLLVPTRKQRRGGIGGFLGSILGVARFAFF